MKNGPVLSRVLELITEMPEAATYWPNHISPPSSDSVKLQSDPGTGSLSDAEVFREYDEYLERPFDLVRYLHDNLPEWDEVSEGRVALPHSKILRVAKSEGDCDAIVAEWQALAADLHALGA